MLNQIILLMTSHGSVPVNTVLPAVTGTVTVGQTLTCSTGTWTGSPAPTYTYQWYHGITGIGFTAIGGKVSSTYVVEQGYVGEELYCKVTATNTMGAVVANSATVGLVVAIPGQLWVWGPNDTGQLGQGNLTDRSSPVQVGAAATWASVATAYRCAFGITSAGKLYSWGTNLGGYGGPLGLGNTTSYSSPKQVGALTNWLSVSAGSNSSVLAIKTDHSLWAWGVNNQGQLGKGNTTSYSSPVQVGALTNWSRIAVGRNLNIAEFSLAIKVDGTLWSWGRGDYRTLGLGNSTNYSSPRQVGAATNWDRIFAGAQHVGARNTGYVWSLWGMNGYYETSPTYGYVIKGQVTGTNPFEASPKAIAGGWRTMDGWGSGQQAATFAIPDTNYKLYSTGSVLSPFSATGSSWSRSSFAQVGSGTTWKSVGISNLGHLLATDGGLWSWGVGTTGKQGNGSTTNNAVPTQIGALTTWLRIDSMGNFSAAIKTA